MIEVDRIRDCKRLHARGMSIRGIARELELSRNTVRAHLRGERVAGQYRGAAERSRPTRDEIRPLVRDLLLEEIENETPRKQRLTAARIHRLLEAKRDVSEASVRRVVREVRLELRDPLQHAYLPLAYRPGEDAQVDFFEGVVDRPDGSREKTFILLVRACYSARTYAYAAPNQTREALLEGLMRSFEFFGGVFQTLWFDNLTPAVKKVLKGRDRVRQRQFAHFEAHYGFRAEFCGPGKGNEKGGVENEVKFSRHEILSPVPTVSSRAEIQALCDDWMERNEARHPRRGDSSIKELWSLERPHLVPLPTDRFDASATRQTRVNPRSWVQVGTNFYSVPVEWVGHEVIVKTEAERIVIHRRGFDPVAHVRRYGNREMILELDHYLPLLHRKCRGLDRSVPFQRWLETAPRCWNALLSALRLRRGEVEGSRDFVETLMLCRRWGAGVVESAIEEALRFPEISYAMVRLMLSRAREQERPKIERMAYAGPMIEVGSVLDYGFLCAGRSM